VLTGIPELLPGHQPVSTHLPLFLLKLALDVNWDDELECFQSIAALLALFYRYLFIYSLMALWLYLYIAVIPVNVEWSIR